MKLRNSSETTTVELTLYIHHQTDKAYLVSERNVRDDAFWLPKSEILEFLRNGKTVNIAIPRWLAEANGYF